MVTDVTNFVDPVAISDMLPTFYLMLLSSCSPAGYQPTLKLAVVPMKNSFHSNQTIIHTVKQQYSLSRLEDAIYRSDLGLGQDVFYK